MARTRCWALLERVRQFLLIERFPETNRRAAALYFQGVVCLRSAGYHVKVTESRGLSSRRARSQWQEQLSEPGKLR
jgi:hypothetical protein